MSYAGHMGIVISKNRGRTRASPYTDVDLCQVHILEDSYVEREVDPNGKKFEIGSIVIVNIRRPAKVVKVISNPHL